MSVGTPITPIPEHQRFELLKRELYKPRPFGLEGQEETGLLMRVKDLAHFSNPEIPVAIKLVAYQNAQNTWVICVILRVMELPPGTLLAAAYLNPRQTVDYDLLLRLSKQQIFPVILLSEDVREYVTIPLAWSAVQREEVLRILKSIDSNLTTHKLSGSFDPDFESAVLELQENHSLEELIE